MVKLTDETYRQIMWDYNIPKEDVEKLLSGEIEFAGHYNIDAIFGKMLKGLTWFSLVKVLGIKFISEHLTDKVINSLWIDSMKKQYFYVKQRLLEII
jgi:hypothetical protein